MESNIIENLNYDLKYNYQLLKNDIILLDTDQLLTSYSVIVNNIKNNRIVKSTYVCDIARDLDTAKRIFFILVNGRVDCETVRECTEELLS